jgi:hypothetical protein
MDKKSSNTGISKSLLRSLNRSYVSEPIRDENKITELISKFINGDIDTIMSVFESNETLNFKDSTGQTLVHAIIRNESPNITEENKLKIIKMLADKNVSLNSMTQLNQNALHLACQKGYVSIIIYLLTSGCNQKLNDNNGNAPVHYIIDKFIDTCKQDDLYKPSNEEIKSVNSGQIKKINDIIKNQNLNIIIKLFKTITDSVTKDKYEIIQDAGEIINGLNKFIHHSTKNLLPIIYKIIQAKIKDINKIFLDKTDSNENKFLKAKNIILSSKEEITKLYKFNLDDNVIIWNDFIQNQKLKIISNKNNHIDKINQSIKSVVSQFDSIKSTMNSIKKEYYKPFLKQAQGTFFIFLYMRNYINQKRLSINTDDIPIQDLAPDSYAYKIIDDGTGNKYIDLVDKQTRDLIEEFHIGNIEVDSKGNIVPMKGNPANYGLAKLLFPSDIGRDVVYYTNMIDLIDRTLDNILINITDTYVDTFTIINHSQFDENPTDSLDKLIMVNTPILLENNDDEDNMLYVNGFLKVELGENIVPGNKKVWIHGTLIEPDNIGKIELFTKKTVLNEFVKAQEQRNKALIDRLLLEKPKNDKEKENKYEIVDNFINSSLFGLSSDKQKEIIFKSYKKTYTELEKIITSQKNLTSKFVTEALLNYEHVIQAMSNIDLDFLADLADNLEKFITTEFSRIVHPIYRQNIIRCINANYAGFGFGLKQIIYSIALENPIIKSIANNQNLMLKLQNKNGDTPNGTPYINSFNFYRSVKDFQNINKFQEIITIFLNFISGFNLTNNDLKIVGEDIVRYGIDNGIAAIHPNLYAWPYPLPLQLNPNQVILLNNAAYYNFGHLPGVYDLEIPGQPQQGVILPVGYIIPTDIAGVYAYAGPNTSVLKEKKNIEAHMKNFPNIIPEYMQYLITKKIFYNLSPKIDPYSSYDILFNNIFPPPLSIKTNIDLLNDPEEPNSLVNPQLANITKTNIIKQFSIKIAETVINYITVEEGLDRPLNANEAKLNTLIGNLNGLDLKKLEEIEKLSKDLIEETINVIILLGANDAEQVDFCKLLGKNVLDTIMNINYNETTSTQDDVILGTEILVSNAIISFTNNFDLIKKELLSVYLPDPNDVEKVKFIPDDINESNIIPIGEKYFLEILRKSLICTPINNLIKIINLNVDMMKNSFELIKNEEKFREQSIQLTIFYIKYYTNVLIRCINNMVLLDKYISDINVEVFKNSSNDLKNILDDFTSESEDKDTTNILEKLKDIKQRTNISNELYDNLIKLEHRKKISKVYNDVLKIFGIFDEIIKNISKYQSEYQLGEYNKFIETYIKTEKKTKVELTNTMFNNYSFDIRENFPDSYETYNEIYISKNENNIYDIKDTRDFLFNENYNNNIVSDNFPYINDFNYNEIYYDVANEISVNYHDSNDNFKEETQSFSDVEIYSSFKAYATIGTAKNKFARGYDTLYNNNNNYNLKSKDEINTLCDHGYILKYSETDVSGQKVEEGDKKVTKYYFAKKLEISNIDFSTYLITNNLSELINLIVYLIYEKIKSNKDNLIDVFFGGKRTKLDIYNVTTGTKKKYDDDELGIEFDEYAIDEKYKKNVLDTLAFLKSDEQEKMNYLLDVIKTFVKIIVGIQINKEIGDIFEEIKISDSDPTKSKKKIIEKNQNQMDINEFNDKILVIKSKYNNLDQIILNIKNSSLSSTSTLEYNQVMRLIKNKLSHKDSKKIIHKCLNIRKTDELLGIESFNYRVLDINGNTIINRLIDQFNLYGIKKILDLKPFLATYKNNNDKTPTEYLFDLMSNIQYEYDEKNYIQRIKKYSLSLSNSIESNEMFTNVSLENCEILIGEIIKNSIYMFNEVMWLKLYDFPTGWVVGNKKELKQVLQIEKEELLIETFDLGVDMKKFVDNENDQLKEKLNLYASKLDEEIKNYENKKKQYEYDKSDLENSLMSEIDVSGNIKIEYEKLMNEKAIIKTMYENNIKDLNKEIDKIIRPNIEKVLNTYKEKKKRLIKSTNINWDEYEQMVNKLDSSYLKIIKILNEKIIDKKVISNFLMNIIKFNIPKYESAKPESNASEKIDKYFNLIFDSVFADYWDLDKYDDSNYNVLNKSILGILSVNVVGIISNELLNTFVNYTIQSNLYTNEIKNKFQDIKNNTDTNSNTILNSIKLYLNDIMITKLGKKNPEKTTYLDSETQKKIIINELNNLVGFKLDSDDLVELGKIIEFNKFLCENISYNCYEEIIKILYDCKKMSIFYKIYNELKNKTK